MKIIIIRDEITLDVRCAIIVRELISARHGSLFILESPPILPAVTPLIRSRYPQFRNEQCFYCQNEKICGGKTERLVTCQSSNIGVPIQDLVDVSGHERWKVNLAHIITDADFLS